MIPDVLAMNVTLATVGLDQAFTGQSFLNPGSECVDAGSSAIADAAYPGEPDIFASDTPPPVWDTLTTRLDGLADYHHADPGFHFDPEADAWLLDFDLGATLDFPGNVPEAMDCEYDLSGTSAPPFEVLGTLTNAQKSAGQLAASVVDGASGATMLCSGPGTGFRVRD